MTSTLATPGSTSSLEKRVVTVALVGNPNCGKTTLFNALSGLHQKVGNYPGVTVEKKIGTVKHGTTTLRLVDLPGTYSLAARSPDELVTVDLLLGQQPGEPKPDLILNIVDASNLERHLFLTTQLADLGIPIVVAVNMMDVAQAGGVALDLDALGRALGVTMVPVQAHRKIGLDRLQQALLARHSFPTCKTVFPPAFQSELNRLECLMADYDANEHDRDPAQLTRLLIDKQGAIEQRYAARFGDQLRQVLQEARSHLNEAGCPVPQIEARTRYAFLRQHASPHIVKSPITAKNWTTRIDRVVTHRVWGLLIFLGLLFVIFQSIFTWAEPLKNGMDFGIKWLGVQATSWLTPGPLKSLIQDGIFGGVGGVLVFLPQIVILFGFLAILEDCGYMARAAFLMDKVMARCGLSGKSFIPLLSSFACAIPGVMATRVIEDRRDRLATILVAPLMSCAARLPVYTLMIAAFVPSDTALGSGLRGLVLFAMYMIGIIVAPLAALVFKRTILRGETPIFILELPPYKRPSLRAILFRMAERGWAFVRRAGTFILASMIVVWALLYFPRTDDQGRLYDQRVAVLQDRIDEAKEAQLKAEDLEGELSRVQGEWKRHSYLGRFGKTLEPAFKPLGWDWRVTTASLASFPAREVIVGVLGILFDLGEVDEEKTDTLKKQLQDAAWEDGSGRKLFTLATALSLMVFFALCCQCASTLAVIRRETNSWRWPIFTFTYMTLLAYVAALATYQVASRLGG